jgi:hypothetical protein
MLYFLHKYRGEVRAGADEAHYFAFNRIEIVVSSYSVIKSTEYERSAKTE